MTSESVGLPAAAARISRLVDSDRATIQSIDRASDILALLDHDTQLLTVGVVSERLGLNRTTAHRYLQSLQRAGFLDGSYGPGPLLEQLAALISGRRKVLSLAPAIMRRLSDDTGVTVVLSVLGQSGPVVALVEESVTSRLLVTVRVGTVLAPEAAQTRVLLAYQSDPAVVERYLVADEPDQRRRRLDELAKIRRAGVGWADLGHLGLAAIAAPVFGSRDIQAAIALISTEKMLPPTARSAEAVHGLRQAAQQLSRLVGA